MNVRKNLIEEIFGAPFAKLGTDHYVALFAQNSGKFGNVVSYELRPEHIKANPAISLADPLAALEAHADPVELARWTNESERSIAVRVIFQAISRWPAIVPKDKRPDEHENKNARYSRTARRADLWPRWRKRDGY